MELRSSTEDPTIVSENQKAWRDKALHIWSEDKPIAYSPENSDAYLRKTPQKTAEAVGMAKDHSVEYGVEFSHLHAAVWHTRYTSGYFRHLNGPAELPEDQHVLMRRSWLFDLSEQDGRKRFFRMLLSIPGCVEAKVSG